MSASSYFTSYVLDRLAWLIAIIVRKLVTLTCDSKQGSLCLPGFSDPFSNQMTRLE